jgi:hypothetical protein
VRHRVMARITLLNSQGVSVDEVIALCAEDIGHLDGKPVHLPFGLRRSGFSPRPGMESVSIGFVIDCKCR